MGVIFEWVSETFSCEFSKKRKNTSQKAHTDVSFAHFHKIPAANVSLLQKAHKHVYTHQHASGSEGPMKTRECRHPSNYSLHGCRPYGRAFAETKTVMNPRSAAKHRELSRKG